MADTIHKNRTALITGASSGIGKATAKRFAREHINLSLVARDQTALENEKLELAEYHLNILTIPADLSVENNIIDCISKTVNYFGKLDILVNAAGIIGSGSIENTSLEDWDIMMNINLRSVFLLMQEAVPHLIKTKGTIVNVSSVTGLRAFPSVLAYCVSKAGVDQLTRCAALDLAEKGIRVNGVNPGVVRTNLHLRGGMDESAYENFIEYSKKTHPLGRIGQPEEIAELIWFLASPQSGWITGTTISIDGGRAQTCAR